MDSEIRPLHEGRQMEKFRFLTIVSEVMKEIITREKMLASLQRSCMRSEAENHALMKTQEENADRTIEGIRERGEISLPEEVLDAMVLRFLRNTQFLAGIPEQAVDLSGLEENDLAYWKKAMLFKTP